jgi:hypothetical protein
MVHKFVVENFLALLTFSHLYSRSHRNARTDRTISTSGPGPLVDTGRSRRAFLKLLLYKCEKVKSARKFSTTTLWTILDPQNEPYWLFRASRAFRPRTARAEAVP